MNETQLRKIEQFLEDKAMSEAVYLALQQAFLEPYDARMDVTLLAASRIAIDMLPEAWKEMRRLVPEKPKEEPAQENPGV